MSATTSAVAPTPGVRLLRVLAPIGALALTWPIVAAFVAAAPIGGEGGEILALAWGVVTMVDLGIALVLGWAWIAWREASPARAVLWLALVTVTGSVGICAYLAGAAWRAMTVGAVLVGPHRSTSAA
jgi:hypothetical protein